MAAVIPKHDSDKSDECIKAEEAEDIVVDCSIQEDALSVLGSGSKVSSRYRTVFCIRTRNFFYGRADPTLTFSKVTIPKKKSCKIKYKKYFLFKTKPSVHIYVLACACHSYIPYFLLVFEHEIEQQVHIPLPICEPFLDCLS